MAKSKKVEAVKKVDKSQVKLFDTTLGKSIKTAIYLILSAGMTAIVNEATNNPTFAGEYTPLVIFMVNNIGLVLLKNLTDSDVLNLPR